MYDAIIRNGRIVGSDGIVRADVCIGEGKIAAILENAGDIQGKSVIDAEGKLLFPGVIDSHAHLNDPGFTWREDYAHGTAAAAVGGVTTVVDMPLQNKPAMTDPEIMKIKETEVAPNACVDYCFWGGLVGYNLSQLKGLHEAGCVAFKSFIGPVSPDYASLTIGQTREALEIIASLGARAGFHCEDFSIIKWEEERQQRDGTPDWRGFLDSRPVTAELIATRNILELAGETGAKVHICHVSHPKVARAIREAQRDGVDVTGETCAHYLTFTEDDLLQKGSLFKCAPPLRRAEDREQLWAYVADGTLSCVGSDHSPCELSEKDAEKHGVFGAWGGISGLQSLLQVMFSEGVVKRGHRPSLLANCLSRGPAKAFGIYGKKGAIQVGFDADIVVLDPKKKWVITPETLLYLNKISAFAGLSGMGCPELTLVRGRVVAENGKPTGEKGFGRLVRRADLQPNV